MKYKYAVFDWDGTLADTYPVISAAYDYTFDKMGLLRIPYDEIKRITSTLQNKDTLGYVFKERRDEAAGYFYEYIEKFHTDRLAPMFGAEKLLGFCREKGLECYLITNKKTRFIKEELEEHPQILEEEQEICKNIQNIREEAKEVENIIKDDLKK